jgi:adenylate cyclase
VHGVCLYSDVERYTALSERLEPAALADVMNRYYEAALEPIQTHGGRVSHIAGDSVLAVWLAGDGDTPVEMQANLAGLGMAAAVARFNEASEHGPLPTRIGLHAGEMSVGEIGGKQRVAYTAIGDIVNTAARIQDLNRHLGTRVLVSDSGLAGCVGFLTRQVGTFLLAGKSTSIVVHELMGLEKEADSTTRTVCALFGHGLDAYRAGSWGEAIEAFKAVRQIVPDDGPSGFYLNECRKMGSTQPGSDWNGVVTFTKR